MKIGILAQNKEVNYTGINKVTLGTVTKLKELYKDEFYFIGKTYWLKMDIPYIPIVPETHRLLLLDYMLEDHNLNIIHSHYRAFDFSRRNKAAKILTIHDLLALLFPDTCPPDHQKYFDECVRKSARNADAIITDSQSTKNDVVNIYGIDEKKVHVVYNGLYPINELDETMYKELPQLKGINYLLSVSAVGRIKNQPGIVKAFIEYKIKHPDSDLKLVFTGPVRQYDNIKIILENYKEYLDEIIITGYISEEELAWTYKNARAFIYASFYEGFGLPILEAMHYGKAVIASNTSSMPEVGGDAVIYCNPNEIDSIEEAIENVLENDELRTSLERKAIEQAKLFTYDETAKKTMSIYRMFQ